MQNRTAAAVKILWAAGAPPGTAMSFVTRAIRADPILFKERDRLTYKAYKFTLFSSTHAQPIPAST